MNKFNIFVCENAIPEFKKAVKKEGFDDVIVKSFPSMCENKRNKAEAERILQQCAENGDGGLIFCGKNCDVLKLIPKNALLEIRSSGYCLSHLVNERIIDYIINRGGYIISLGWLNQWKQNVSNAGFDKNTARMFYKEFCTELVFFDAKIDKDAEQKLKELSEFLALPYVMIPVELEYIQRLVKSAVYEWKLRNKSKEYAIEYAEIQSQCAEYSAILDLMGKISTDTNKRETIEKIKEIFVMIFGAQKFKFCDADCVKNSLPIDMQDWFLDRESLYYLIKQENRFCIKIQQRDKVFGAVDVGDFMFPQYIEKYLNFAIEICKICGLVLSNIEQYERLLKSEHDLQYSNFHDSLTGLYNRAYINDIIFTDKKDQYLTAFVFDIDKLKYVNDNFGHLEGDKLICGVSDILKHCFRETDVVARIGGDEFVAFLPQCDIKIVERIQNRLREAIYLHNKNKQLPYLEISISVGVVISENNGESIETLMKKADALMYEDKMSKRR